MVGTSISIDSKELEKVIDDQMDDIIDFIFAQSQQNIVSKNIVDEGTLLKSGIIQRNFLNKKIIYSAPYSDSIEFGRLPGSMPPVAPIKGWVQRKLGVRNDKEAKSIAWAIATDLKKNGTSPRPFLQPAIDLARTRLKLK